MSMAQDQLTDTQSARIHWMTLFLRLPEKEITSVFKDDSAFEQRLRETRWPNGPICTRCSEKNIGQLDQRKIFVCRKCNAQFSLTSGTILHRSRVSLRVYFELSADIIRYKIRRSSPTGHGIKDKYGIAYATAVRLKEIISRSLEEEDGGLLGRCICVEPLELPQDFVPGTEKHLLLLEQEHRQRQWRKAGFE